MKKVFKKVGIIFGIIVGVLAVLNIGASIGVRAWIKEDESNEVPHLVLSALRSFNSVESKEVKEFKKTMGGVACGVCHPDDDPVEVYLLQEANIEWVRFDIPSSCPFELDDNGNFVVDNTVNGYMGYKKCTKKLVEYDDKGNPVYTNPFASYMNYVNRCKLYKDSGYKVMGITPYLDDMLFYCDSDPVNKTASRKDKSYDVFVSGGEYTDKFKNMIKNLAAFYAKDLNGVVDCFQVSNELNVDKWQGACSVEQVIYFQGEQMKAMYDICKKNGQTVGFNFSALTLYFYPKAICDQYSEYFDYVGFDLYLGCFEGDYHTTLVYDLLLRAIYDYSGHKPVMLNEFGYISAGKDQGDDVLLKLYGEEFDTEEKIKANIVGFLDKFDEVNGNKNGCPMTTEARRKITENGGESNPVALKAAVDYVFGKTEVAHIYKELPSSYYLSLYEHTEEGQGKFYNELIGRLRKMNFMCGFFVYCFADSTECYQCGGEGCPVETGWGLVSVDPNTLNEDNSSNGYTYNKIFSYNIKKKASFYSVQKQFGIIQKQNKKYNK